MTCMYANGFWTVRLSCNGTTVSATGKTFMAAFRLAHAKKRNAEERPTREAWLS